MSRSAASTGMSLTFTQHQEESGRHIPADVKRQVRQRCGFGCIFCGSPLFTYDHLRDFAVVKEHDPENLNLLCPNHHAAKTADRLSVDTVKARAAKPINLSSDRSHSGMPLDIFGSTVAFDIGTNVFESDASGSAGGFTAIEVTSRPMISASWEQGWIVLNMVLTDEAGTPVIVVDQGELRTSTSIWDFELVGKTLTVRAGHRQVTTRLIFKDNGLKIDQGYFIQGPWAVKVQPDHLNIGSVSRSTILGVPKTFHPGMKHSRGLMSGCSVGLQCGGTV